MSYRIVVSRYNESLEWLKYPNAVVYNKGEPLFLNSRFQMIDLPNKGREGHTYLTYIIDNYDKLPDYTFFFQGDPVYHCKQLAERLPKAICEIASNEAKDFIPMTDVWQKTYLSGCPYHKGLPIREVYTKLFGPHEGEKSFEFGSGAQFAVSRRLIHTRPREFYERVRSLLAYAVNPIEGYVIERMWPTIFNAKV